jgi:predicted metallo-beta-lactamase superfamily hydrolase
MGLIMDIIGAESLGARGLCCLVCTPRRRIVIDPGIALGFIRHGLLPHPLQIATGITIRKRILAALGTATDVVISHLHGDHIPLADANPYQLDIRHLAPASRSLRWWCPPETALTPGMRNRFTDLESMFGPNLRVACGSDQGEISFSPLFPHGGAGSREGAVMMTRIDDGGHVFVHASDIQLLDDRAVDHVIQWRPTTVIAAGPPLYLDRLGVAQRELARRNAIRLIESVRNVILDHHLLRSVAGLTWLRNLSDCTGRRVYCAAEWMGRPVRLLEARRSRLYEEMPVPEGWHEKYANGETDIRTYFQELCGNGFHARYSMNSNRDH